LNDQDCVLLPNATLM